MKYLISAFLTLAATSLGWAQEPATSVNDAVALALEKNPTVQAAALETSRQMALKKTSFDMPKTDVSLLYGQYNSIQKNDNNITAVQSLPFPTVFTRQNSLGKSLIASAMLKEDIVRNELTLQVKQTFNQILYLKEKYKTLLRQDSLLTDLAKAASLQYATGEGTLINKTSAETHLMEIKELLIRNQAYIQNAIHQLQLICQSENIQDVEGDLESFASIDPIDSVHLEQNPLIVFSKQQIELAQWQRKVEGARILPDLKVGYFSQTLIGTQNVNGQDQYFGSDKRFQGFQAGVSIPLWYGAHNARIKAASLAGDAARKQEEATQLSVLQLAQRAQQDLTLNKNSLKYYRESALPMADLITHQSQVAFKSGVMDYSTLLLNLKQALTIRENYLTALFQYNDSVINLHYLNGNK